MREQSPSTKKRRRPGRAVVNVMPDPIPDTPESVLRAVLAMPEMKRDDWRYMQNMQQRSRGRQLSARCAKS